MNALLPLGPAAPGGAEPAAAGREPAGGFAGALDQELCGGHAPEAGSAPSEAGAARVHPLHRQPSADGSGEQPDDDGAGPGAHRSARRTPARARGKVAGDGSAAEGAPATAAGGEGAGAGALQASAQASLAGAHPARGGSARPAASRGETEAARGQAGAASAGAPTGRTGAVRPAAGARLAAQAAVARGALPLPSSPRSGPSAKPAHGEKARAPAAEEPARSPGESTPLAAAPARLDTGSPPAAAPDPARSAQRPAALAAAAAPAPAGLPRPGQVDGAVLRHAAHLRVETPQLGEIELHLRVREGVAHLRVSGDSAHLVEARAAELSSALAGHGLKLGDLEVPAARDTQAGGRQAGSGSGAQGQRGRDGAPFGEEAAPPLPRPTPRRAAATPSGGVHVKA